MYHEEAHLGDRRGVWVMQANLVPVVSRKEWCFRVVSSRLVIFDMSVLTQRDIRGECQQLTLYVGLKKMVLVEVSKYGHEFGHLKQKQQFQLDQVKMCLEVIVGCERQCVAAEKYRQFDNITHGKGFKWRTA